MKKETYTRKDGTDGEVYTLEPGDKVQYQRVHVRQSKFGQQTAMITVCGKYVNLTNGQAKVLENKDVQEGDTIEAYGYKNDYGEQVGVKVTHTDSVKSTQSELPMKVSSDGFVEFASEYKELVGDKGNSMHMLGAYVANKCKDQFQDIIALCKKEGKKVRSAIKNGK